jgi:hypothetical protein
MRRNPLLAIFTTVFIDLVGFGILIPVFPLLIVEIGINSLIIE